MATTALCARATMVHRLPESLQASLPGLYQAALHPLEFGGLLPGLVTKKAATVTLQQAVLNNNNPTVAFVVRRPG
jgi:hypothetical protein